MWIAVGLLIVCTLAAPLLSVLAVRWWIRTQTDHITDALNAELTKLVAGEPCQSGSVLNAIGTVIGSAAGRSAKASLMADLSHLKRAENSQETDQQLSMLGGQSPALASAFGALGKHGSSKMLKNPIFQLALQALLSGGLGGGNHGAPAGSSGSAAGSVVDRIRSSSQ